MSSEANTATEVKLRPEAPPYIPISKHVLQVSKEPQCSRYSRRSVRRDSCPNSPRPILGNKLPFPRPILGRRESLNYNEEDEFIGKEFRSVYRRMQKLKLNDENDKNLNNTSKSH